MKKKFCFALIAVVILGLGAFWTWSYFKPVDASTYAGFLDALKRNGYKVEDVTQQHVKNYKMDSSDGENHLDVNGEIIRVKSNRVVSGDEKYLDVNGETLYVIIGKAETIDSILKESIAELTNPAVDFLYFPLLYNKGNLVVTYVGKNEKLIKTLEELFGNSLIN